MAKMSETRNLRELYQAAELQKHQVDSTPTYSGPEYHENLNLAIQEFEKCRDQAARLSVFSPNESLEDVASGDIQYMQIDFQLGDLISRRHDSNRGQILKSSQGSYDQFLNLVDLYDILSPTDKKLYEEYQEAPTSFSTTSKKDAAARRESKIARFREEKQLKSDLEYLAQNPNALQNDDAALRKLCKAQLQLCIHQTFQALESIAQELEMLAMASDMPSHTTGIPSDERERNGQANAYSDRLDPPISQLLASGKTGPILSKDGKPLQPFTLLDSRDRLRQGVFRPGHNLPTMTIDEYLEEEKRRGGIIEGGGEQSGIRPEPDEDNFEKADAETMKAREWDEFTEENPKGSGNTLNRG